MDEEKQAQVPFFLHENALMHKDKDNARMHKTIWALCITFVLVIAIFVAGYTIRTKEWLKTIDRQNAVIVEVCNAKGITPP